MRRGKIVHNIYDIRNKEERVYILPNIDLEDKSNKKITLIVNLYYEELLLEELRYISQIDEEITVVLISSNNTIINFLEAYEGKKDNWIIEKKVNRGRDISALLVCGRKYVETCDYLCFMHDKKEHGMETRDETRFWNKNLWENMLAGNYYIRNVIARLEKEDDLGLLVPPEPIGDYLNAWYTKSWGRDFENTKKLARDLGIKADISSDYPPATIGTMFWCKTKAIKSLYNIPWKYESFDDEPLAKDGTINHAIERVIAYVTQDAGYKMGTVMVDTFASEMYITVQEKMRESYQILEDIWGVSKLVQLQELPRKLDFAKNIFKKNSCIYLYGAGIEGKRWLKILRSVMCEPLAFLETSPQSRYVDDLPVYSIEEIEDKNICIIIATNSEYYEEIEEILKGRGFNHFYFFKG